MFFSSKLKEALKLPNSSDFFSRIKSTKEFISLEEKFFAQGLDFSAISFSISYSVRYFEFILFLFPAVVYIVVCFHLFVLENVCRIIIHIL